MITRDFTNDTEVADLVRAFETASIPAAEFTHAAHIAVAVSYLARYLPDEAFHRMRENVRTFAAHHGATGLYHETLTTFWMRLLEHVLANEDPNVPLWQRINKIVAVWTTRRPIDAHYAPETINSAQARAEWVAPDRLPLPF